MARLSQLLDGRLWPDFDLEQHSIAIDSATGWLYCVGKCGGGSGWMRTIRDETLKRMDHGYAFVAGTVVGLPDEATVLTVRMEMHDDPVAVIMTAVHEGFHAYYQADRDALVPFEMKAGESAPRGAFRTREELTATYALYGDRMTALSQEIQLIGRAARELEEREEVSRNDIAVACLDAFIASRNRRRAAVGAPVLEEDIWERVEGIPLFLERRTAYVLGIEDRSVLNGVIQYGAVPELHTVPYFMVTGALQAEVLHKMTGERWRDWVFPGRAGEGLPLFDAVVEARALIERTTSVRCPEN